MWRFRALLVCAFEVNYFFSLCGLAVTCYNFVSGSFEGFKSIITATRSLSRRSVLRAGHETAAEINGAKPPMEMLR